MPVWDPDELRRRIGRRAPAPVHVLVGEDVRLMDQLVGELEATVDEIDRPFALDRFHAGEEGAGPADVAAAARVLPMLGDRRIVVVRRAERWLKPKRAGKAVDGAAEEAAEDGEDAGGGVDLGALEAYLEAPVPSAVLVFVASSVDRSRRFTKRLLEQAAVTWCGGLQGARPGEAAQLERAVADQVRREIDQAGRSIEGAAVEMLVRRAGGDISKLRDDVERLLLYTGKEPRITRGDVDEVVADGGAMVDDWAVVNAIADGDAARALRAAAGRLERGDSPHQLVGQLRWWVSTRLAEGAPERVKPALDALLRTDLALKRSGGDERVLLERLVVELTGRPVSRQGGWHGRRG